MAEDASKIDTLSLNISVRDNNSAKKILQVSNAIRNLTNSLKGLDKVSDQLKTLQSVFSSVGSIGSRARSAGSGKDVLQKASLKEELKNSQLAKIQSKKDLVDAQTEKNKLKTNLIASQAEDIKNRMEGLGKATKKTTGFFKGFVKSIGRIAFYRLIRTALKEITQSAKEGLENLRQVDKQLDTSLNKLSLAGTSLKDSFATILSPFIQSLEPIITRLSDSIASIVNRFREANAVANGQSKYIKILTSDMEEYKKQIDKTNGSLLSFDTFTLLSQKSSYTGVKEVETEMGLEEAKSVAQSLEKIKTAIEGIAIAIGGLVATKLIGWLTTVSTLVGLISSVLFASGILAAIEGVRAFINAWNDMSTWQKILGVLETLVASVVALVVALKLLHGNWLGAIGIAAGIGGAVAMVNASIAKSKSFANGGSFNSADMFYANENGNTELIASSNRGGAVMNMEQLQSAIYNGMILAMADSGDKEIVLRVDNNTLGRVVANSTGFISETNRRNSSLKLV